MGRYVWGVIDADNDRRQVGFEIVDMTALNFDAQVTEQNALNTALAAVTLGTVKIVQRIATFQDLNVAPPANNFAQTNIVWDLEYEDDTTGNRYHYFIPTADLAEATVEFNGAPALDLTVGTGLALKTAFEDVVLHDGNPVTLIAVYFRE